MSVFFYERLRLVSHLPPSYHEPRRHFSLETGRRFYARCSKERNHPCTTPDRWLSRQS